MMKMKIHYLILSVMFIYVAGCQKQAGKKITQTFTDGETVKVSKAVLQDKIKGGLGRPGDWLHLWRSHGV